MSERAHVVPTPEGEYFERNRFAARTFVFALIGFVGLAVCVLGAILDPRQFAFSWLFAFTVFFTLCAGCLFWTIVHHCVDAEWSVVVRRQLENIAILLPVLALFFIPILLLRHELYAWMSVPEGQDALLDAKRGYLNQNFFLIRTAIYFTVLSLTALSLRRLSILQDRNGNPRYTLTMRKIAFAGLILFGLSLTFGAFDWLMSLSYTWFSTMWGVYIFAGAAGSSMSLLVLVISALRSAGYLKDVVSIEHYHVMGKWMLAFTIFWAYIGFSQYVLIWYANMPEETQYFILRNTESWWVLSLVLVTGRFFGPFVILLMRSVKKTPQRLCFVAGWIILMQILDMYVVILPNLHGTGARVSIWDFVCLIGIGATLAFIYLRIVGRSSLFPQRDPRVIESLRMVN